MKKVVFILICAAVIWFSLASEGILTYDRNKGTFELLWQNKAAGHSADSGSVVVDSIMFRH